MTVWSLKTDAHDKGRIIMAGDMDNLGGQTIGTRNASWVPNPSIYTVNSNRDSARSARISRPIATNPIRASRAGLTGNSVRWG